jgi:hypothetical protein
MEARFEQLGTGPNTAQRGVSANTTSLSRFRFVGLFRSSSRTWVPTPADEANLSNSPPATLLKKKNKMRELG